MNLVVYSNNDSILRVSEMLSRYHIYIVRN